MTALRARLRRYPALAAWLILAALATRLLVPAGFMPAWSGGMPTLALCSGAGPITLPMPRMAHHMPDTPAGKPGAEQPCAFAGLALPGLAAADPVSLVAALLFTLALSPRRETRAPPAAPRHLRPPLRGPPEI